MQVKNPTLRFGARVRDVSLDSSQLMSDLRDNFSALLRNPDYPALNVLANDAFTPDVEFVVATKGEHAHILLNDVDQNGLKTCDTVTLTIVRTLEEFERLEESLADQMTQYLAMFVQGRIRDERLKPVLVPDTKL